MKSKFIKSTIILIIGGAVTKILGMIIKIIINRSIGLEALSLYTLITPTFMLLITLAQLGLPTAISKIVSEEKIRSKKIILPIIPIAFLFNIILLVITLFCSHYIAIHFLHTPNSDIPIMCMGFVLPFINISSILRGYFFGKQKMIPHVISNIIEDIIRLLILIIGIPIFIKYGVEVTVCFIILSNIVCEICSIIVLLFFLPKKIKLDRQSFKYNKEITNNVLSIGLPTTGSRLIGSFCHFLEPIILTNILLFLNYSNDFILLEYGIINGYVMPLLLLPSFFTTAISQALLPVISKSYVNHNYSYALKKLKQAISFSLFIGIPSIGLMMLFPQFFLSFIFNTSKGINYLYLLGPFFLLYYIQTPLTACLQAMNKAKEGIKITLISSLIKLFLLTVLTLFKIDLYGLIISIIINIIFVTYFQYRIVKKGLIINKFI